MTLIADVFAKLLTSKNRVRKVSKNSRFRGPFHKQHGKRVLLITEKAIELEKVSLRDIQNLKTVFENIDCS